MHAFTKAPDYYEALSNPAGRLEREGPFLVACLERAPGTRCLDLACGTGLHALFLAEHGGEVTAMDVSQAMIEHARRARPHPRIVYRSGDMRRLKGGPWDAAFCLGNSLSLLPERTDLDATFAAVCAALTPGGLLTAQILNYAAAAAQTPRHRVERARCGGAEVVAVKSLVPHGRRTLLALTFFPDADGHGPGVSESAVLRNWRLEDLRQAAEQAGLRVDACYGGYGRQRYLSDASPDLVIVFTKPG